MFELKFIKQDHALTIWQLREENQTLLEHLVSRVAVDGGKSDFVSA
jgi:hypothetical protein